MLKCGCQACSADPEQARQWALQSLTCQNVLPAADHAQEPSSSSSGSSTSGNSSDPTGPQMGVGTNTTAIGTTGNFTNSDINGLLSGNTWGGLTVTYSFPTAASNYGTSATYSDPAPFNGFQPLSAAQQAVARYALGLIAQYSQLNFVEMAETDTSHAAIRLAGSAHPSTSYAYYPGIWSTAGDAFFGNIRNSDPTKAGYAFDTILHEIGHAVGLKHGHEDDGTHGVLPASHDSTEWSVMTYHAYIGSGLSYSNADGSGNQTYMIDDIAALQYMYGANFTTNAGNTVYSWSPTTGEMFVNGVGQGAATTDTVYEAVWDGNGTDTYDLSAYSTNLRVDLRPGEWSTFDTAQLANLGGGNLAHGNVANAYKYLNADARSLIENATGGTGNDTLQGNEADNTLVGGAGDDTFIGGPGNDVLYGDTGSDTAVFSGNTNAYTVALVAGTHYIVSGPDGTDSLYDIARLQFNDDTVNLPAPAVASTLAISGIGTTRLEGTSGVTPFVFTVTRSGSLAASQRVDWAVSAANGGGTLPADAADFAGGVLPSGTLTFTVGETSRTITVGVAADALRELNERFAVTLSNALDGATITTATTTGVILNDDSSLAIGPGQSRAEGNSGGTPFVFTVTRGGLTSAAATVDWTVSGGTVAGTLAANAADFAGQVPLSGMIAFAAGQTSQTLTIAVAGDPSAELNESFAVTLSNATGGAVITGAKANGVIYDDDTLYATGSNDTLVGTVGADLFVIGAGLHSLIGGLGTDTFRFLPAALGPSAVDTSTFGDFSRRDGEKFDLARIDAIAGTPTDDAFSFIGAAAFSGMAGQLRWTSSSSGQLIQGDVNGDSVADLTIALTTATPIDATWFVL